ncbi:MAG: hypothetical protein ACJ8GW_16290 [Massilia sp.]
MRPSLKKTLLVVLAFGLCWGGAIWYWRATNRMPATADLVIYLLVLPVLLLLLIWLGAKLVGLIGAAPVAAAVAAPAAAADTPSAAPAAPALAIIGSALRLPHGASPEELSEALQENKARADLDPQLQDDQGYPIMTARSEHADGSSVQEALDEWLVAQRLPPLELDEEQWRALTMGSAVANELASQAASLLIPAEGTPATLRLMPMLPPGWKMEQRRVAGLWLRHVVEQAGWPAAHIALAAELPADARGATPAAVLGRLAHHASSADAATAAMIVACGSHLGEASVNQWNDNATLFTATRPQGLIPGEGAAGLLLADLRQIAALEIAPPVLLHLVDEARRHNSADDAKRADADLLGNLTEKVLARAQSKADEVVMVVADTGHRTSRVLELMGLAAAALPQLDETADVLRVGAASGTCGAVPFMAALALARHHALERAAPILCISNEDAYRRCAALIRPAASLS